MTHRHALPFALVSFVVLAFAMTWAVAAQNDEAKPTVDADRGDTEEAEIRAWDGSRDFPQPIAAAKDVKFDYPIVYVRVPRPYPKEYYNINHLNQAGLHQTNAPGAELRILFPDGKDELLVGVEPKESITDPMVSFDAKSVYFAKFHHMDTGASASMTNLQSRKGSDIYRIDLDTRKVTQLTTQARSPATGAIPEGVESHPRGVHNLGPCPVAGGKIVFVSDRHGIRGVREETQPALQLFVMDADGSNVDFIGPLNLGAALHPVALKDGRVMFSSLETQGLRSDERWGIWAIHPDGTNWNPLTSALGSPDGQAVHFQAQLSDESIVVESYYQSGSTDGFGTFWKFPVRHEGQPAFMAASQRFKPRDMVRLTLFSNFQDIRPNHQSGNVNNEMFGGQVTHPSAAPDNNMLLVWSLPSDAQDQSTPQYDTGICLLKAGRPINHPSKMLLVKNDPKFQELWPRAVVPYKRIFGIDEPPVLSHRNDGKQSKALPAGTPLGLVGSSSLYKRESYPTGAVPVNATTSISQTPADRKQQWRDLSVARFGFPGNWGEQGGDAGLYENSDIWGVRILVLEPVSDVVWQKHHHFALGSNSEERIRILGEFPVRKFDGDKQLTDPDGNPDTSFLAKIPADVAWTFQTIDHRGMTLNMAQTWHQVRPGEVRNNCGGCHAHSQQPTDFALTAAAKDDYKIWDLASETPLFTMKAKGASGRKWDKQDATGVRIAKTGVQDIEFYRDIKPLLERSCVACHSHEQEKPAGHLALDDYRPLTKQGLVPWAENVRVAEGLPHTYWRLAQYSWAFQSRRSPLVWKLYGQRLDGFANDDVESPALDYHDEQSVLNWCHHSKRYQYDVDFAGTAMPPPKAVSETVAAPDGQMVKVPPLSDEEKLTFARWIDIGCPIDRDYDAEKPMERGRGWLLDEGRPTLTLTSPAVGVNSEPLSRILLGMHDYGTGLDLDSLQITADVAIDGVAAGENLASRFKPAGEGIWQYTLARPLDTLPQATMTVVVRDRQGNASRIERKFSVEAKR